MELLDALVKAERLIGELLQGDDALIRRFHLFNGGATELSSEWLAQAEQFISSFQSVELSLSLKLRACADLLGAYGAYASAGPDGDPTACRHREPRPAGKNPSRILEGASL